MLNCIFPKNFTIIFRLCKRSIADKTVVFTSWVEQILLPNLPKESVIVMDNAAFHKGKDMEKMLKDSGHTLLYLPPYSPDLNPIEKKWAQAKHIRRTTLCTIDDLFTNYLM